MAKAESGFLLPDFTADLTNNFQGGIQVLLKRDRLLSRTCLAISFGSKKEHQNESYDSVIKRNGGEAKERAISDRISEKVKEVYRRTSKEQDWGYSFPEGNQNEGIKLVKI